MSCVAIGGGGATSFRLAEDNCVKSTIQKEYSRSDNTGTENGNTFVEKISSTQKYCLI